MYKELIIPKETDRKIKNNDIVTLLKINGFKFEEGNIEITTLKIDSVECVQYYQEVKEEN